MAAVRAYLLAVLAAAVTATLSSLFLSWMVSVKAGLPWQFSGSDARIMLLMLAIFAVVSALVLLIAFIPATLIFANLQVERPWIYPALGFLVGLLAIIPFADSLPIWLDPVDLAGLALFGIAGSVAGYIWWAMYRRLVA